MLVGIYVWGQMGGPQVSLRGWHHWRPRQLRNSINSVVARPSANAIDTHPMIPAA